MFRRWTIYFTVGAWAFFGVVQTFIDRNFGEMILPRFSTTTERGVVGLSPEPAKYGAACLFLLVIIALLKREYKISPMTVRLLSAALIFQLILFSRSTLSLAMLALYATAFALRVFRFKKLLVIAAISGILLFGIYSNIDKLAVSVRALQVLRMVIRNPSLVYIVDGSINARLANLIVPWYSLFDKLPFSFGYGTSGWPDYAAKIAYKFPSFWSLKMTGADDRVNSGFGLAIFELGYVGLIYPIATLITFWSHKDWEIRIAGCFVVVLMYAAAPLPLPYYGFLIGSSEALRRLKRKNDEVDPSEKVLALRHE
jgi:hypothetical protein